jgi:hypothetical protein
MSFDKVVSRPMAIAFSSFQNASSRLMLVLWPATTTERLITVDFIKSLSYSLWSTPYRSRTVE